MRSLLVSLYAAVFAALFGLGWLIDQLYSHYNTAPPSNTHAGYHQVLALATARSAELLPDSLATRDYLAEFRVPAALEPLSELPLPPELASQLAAGTVITLASEHGITLHRRVPQQPWVISLGPLADEAPSDDDTRYLLTLLFYSGVAGILLLWVAPLLRGVHQLGQAAQRIGGGDLSARVETSGRSQLAPLKREFNAMAERLQRLSENNRLLSQAISHELRTPLARMRFAVDMLAGRDNQAERAADLQRLERDIDAMEALTGELLGFARFEQQPTLTRQVVPFEQFLLQRIELWREQGCAVVFEPSSPQRVIEIDPRYLGKAIDNLLKNACQHASQRVAVSCDWQPSRLQVRIEDDGAGIPEDQRQRVFETFHRLGDSGSGGFGLGLAIAQKVVAWHGGTLQVEAFGNLGGACLLLCLPLGKQIGSGVR